MFANGKCIFPAIPVLILTIIMGFTESFILGDEYIIHENNVTVEDFTVDFDIGDEEYEMNVKIKDNVEGFSEDTKKFYRFNGTGYINNFKEKATKSQTSELLQLLDLVNLKGKREVSSSTKGIGKDFRVSATEKNEKYDTGFKIMDFLKMLKYPNHTAESSRICLKRLLCLIAECTEHPEYKVLALPIWNIVLIWLLVYFIVAIPLWCTRGWCSCCLFCKFFKPQETIREAKKYILLNPPGILVTKRGGIIHYEPTEREKDCYERFVHFIRTL